MIFPKIAIDSYVPASIVRDVNQTISVLRDKGCKSVFIQIPIEDFNYVMTVVAPTIGQPFQPTLCNFSVVPWVENHVGVMPVAMEDKEESILTLREVSNTNSKLIF